jgi:hypothetical protein
MLSFQFYEKPAITLRMRIAQKEFGKPYQTATRYMVQDCLQARSLLVSQEELISSTHRQARLVPLLPGEEYLEIISCCLGANMMDLWAFSFTASG